MWLGEHIDVMLFNGIEVQALKPKVNYNSYYSREHKKEFNLYYISIRISGTDFSSSWCSADEANAFILGITREEYRQAVVQYGGRESKEPCIISFFKTAETAQHFIEEFVYPLLMSTKLKYMDKKVINRGTYPKWQG